jgi:hypothetical protein
MAPRHHDLVEALAHPQVSIPQHFIFPIVD